MSPKLIGYFLIPFAIAFLTELQHFDYSIEILKEKWLILFLKSLLPGFIAVKALYDQADRP